MAVHALSEGTSARRCGRERTVVLFSFAQAKPEVLSALHAHLRGAIASGLPVAFGTDAGVIPHGANAGEFEHLSAVGLDLPSALRTATVAAARAVGMPRHVGTSRRCRGRRAEPAPGPAHAAARDVRDEGRPGVQAVGRHAPQRLSSSKLIRNRDKTSRHGDFEQSRARNLNQNASSRSGKQIDGERGRWKS